MATGNAKGTTAHTAADGHGKGVFPPFQSETFASQLVSFAIAFALLYFIVSRFALPRVGGIIAAREGATAGLAADVRGEAVGGGFERGRLTARLDSR